MCRYSSALRLIELIVFDLVRFAFKARCEADQALRMLRENLFIDARLVVETFEMRRANEFDQILVAGLVLRQQDQVKRRIPRAAGFFLKPRPRRDVRLATNNRFQSGLRCSLVELHRSIHAAVIGHRDGRHLACVRLLYRVRNPARPIEQAVLGVQVKMDKVRMFHTRPATL
jgi:hypothetical protein